MSQQSQPDPQHDQQPDAQPTLDLDAWLDDVDLPVADVTIYAKASLVGEHDRLTEEIRQQHAADRRVDEDDRGIDYGARAAELEQQRAEVLEQMRSSARTFRLRGLTQDQHAALLKAATDTATGRVDAEKMLRAGIAAMCDDLTVDAVDRLRARLPLSQWFKLSEAANRLLVGEVALPFS